MQTLLKSKEVNGKSKLIVFCLVFDSLSFPTKVNSEQKELQKRYEAQDVLGFDPITLQGMKYVAGVDLSFPLGDNENAVACLVVLSMPDLKVKKQKFKFCLCKPNLFF